MRIYSIATITAGVPKESVLGPLLFQPYSADVAVIASHHCSLLCRWCADLCIRQIWWLTEATECIEEIGAWMSSNQLKINSYMTHFIWFHLISSHHFIFTDWKSAQILYYSAITLLSVCNLNVHLDWELTMKTLVCLRSFYQQRHLHRHSQRGAGGCSCHSPRALRLAHSPAAAANAIVGFCKCPLALPVQSGMPCRQINFNF